MKAVIPAAGRGTRMRPLTNYISKPMLPLGKKPVLQHIIEEFEEVGITEIGVVIKSNDREIIKYFEGNEVVKFIFDDTLSGPGGAILNAESFVGKEDFIIAFADAPFKGMDRPAYIKSLLSLKKEKDVNAVLAIYPIEKNEVSARGVVEFGKNGNSNDKSVCLTNILEKPQNIPNDPWASACRYVLDHQIFKELRNVAADENGEIQLTPAIQNLIQKRGIVLGCPLWEKVKRYDVGNFEGYFKAQKVFMEKDK